LSRRTARIGLGSSGGLVAVQGRSKRNRYGHVFLNGDIVHFHHRKPNGRADIGTVGTLERIGATIVSSMIRLQGSEPIAYGLRSFVFQHPHNSELLIKVGVPEVINQGRGKVNKLLHEQRYGAYVGWVRELREYLALRSRLRVHPPWLQRLIGFVETDIGLGLVVGKVQDGMGALAPTLEQIVAKDGLTNDLRKAINKLEHDLLARNVIFGDPTPRNILFAPNTAEDTHLVIIDGLGDNRLQSMSAYLSRRGTRRRFARLISKLEHIDRGRVQALLVP
jgi:hypothetical protein